MAKELMEIGGFITEGAEIVNHDNSLSGNGTVDSPLGLNETVLWEGFKTDIPNAGISSYTLAELATNFERVKVIYVLQHNTLTTSENRGIGTFEMVMNKPYSRNVTYVHCVMNGSSATDAFILYDIDTNIYNMDTLTWGVMSVLRGQATNGQWFHITKIIGINRIANN